jgi:hypothetical protein
MIFYPGLHHPADARHFPRCMVSVASLRGRKSDFPAHEWIMDSGAFTAVARDGGYRVGVEPYAEEIARWSRCGDLAAAVAQDWMCEPFVLAATGKTTEDHQRLTIERYDALLPLVGTAYVMPVVQGYHPTEYARHVRDYGRRLVPGAWVGVGSVCRRNGNPDAIARVLAAITGERPDLRLHGFGIKLTALRDPRVRAMLWSADSMAWSFAARKAGRNADDYREAIAYAERVEARSAGPAQPLLL